MKQQVAFSPTTPINFSDALAAARSKYPDTDFSIVTDATSLSIVLQQIGLTLFVDFDPQDLYDAAVSSAEAVAQRVNTELSSFECDDQFPPQVLQTSDLNADLCIQQDFPPPPPIPDISQSLSSLQANVDKHAADLTSIKQCLAEMQDITNVINELLVREQQVMATVQNLQELQYNFRIMGNYFQTRTDTLNKILGTFDPLITQQNLLQAQINKLQPEVTAALKKYDDDKGNNNVSLQVVDADLSNYNTLNGQLTAAQDQLKQVQQQLAIDTNKIAPFTDRALVTGDDQARINELSTQLKNLFGGVNNGIDGIIAAFSTATMVSVSTTSISLTVQDQTVLIPDEAFSVQIRHKLVDDARILAGHSKTYETSDSSSTIISPTPNEGGVLYTQLYNIWGNVDKFFTPQERGLTPNSSLVDPTLPSGVQNYDSLFIQSLSAFTDFYQNFQVNWNNKVTRVKSNIIEPTLKAVTSQLDAIAVQEVQFLLAYGLAFQVLPADSPAQQNIIQALQHSAATYQSKLADLNADVDFAIAAHQTVLDDIEKERQKYSTVTCAQGASELSGPNPPPPGSDPLGVTSLNGVDASNPNPTKFCYWEKFADNATGVNILPLPGPGGFRYWPIGLVIPGPNGVTKIPLPILWIPIAVIPLPAGLFVVFVAECGLCPSPVVFFAGTEGEKKFIISLRPGDEFGSDASQSSIRLMPGGVGVLRNINDMLNDVHVPGFEPLQGSSGVVDQAQAWVASNLNKLGQPDTSAIDNLPLDPTVAEKLAALKRTLVSAMAKLTVPDIVIPKDSSTVNPKPPGVTSLISQLEQAARLNLPGIAIPTTSTVSIKQKLLAAAGTSSVSHGTPDISIPPAPAPDATQQEKDSYANAIRNALSNISNAAMTGLTATTFGVFPHSTPGVGFLSAYQCNNNASGTNIPTAPGLDVGKAALAVAVASALAVLTFDMIDGMMQGTAVTAFNINALLGMVLESIPDISIPDPSNASIVDLITGGSYSLSAIALPQLPDPTVPLQPQVTIPGNIIQTAITQAAEAAIDGFPAGLVDFSSLQPIDIKQMLAVFVEEAFASLADIVRPFVGITSLYVEAKDQTLGQTLGLSAPSSDNSTVVTVDSNALAAAKVALEALATVPYTAVLVAPQAFVDLHPILANDDLPPWERLTLENFLFVLFLDEWCTQGKKTCGFFENP